MSKIKPLLDENIFNFLQQESIGEKQNDDPISKTEVSVTLDQLQPYALNPRRTKNPKYDEILYSIETVGLDHPPRITRRAPEDEKYSIRDGGNTRLEILWELYEKYKKLAENCGNKAEKLKLLEKADSFYRINCDFYPWYDDTQALSAHMRENEARGETKFIEKALAVQKLHELYIKEDNLKARSGTELNTENHLSLRQLSERISKNGGWKVNYSHISRFNYAVDTLLKYIPNVFWAGAGEPLVRKLSSLINAYQTFWKATDQGIADPDKIQDIFYNTLSEFDDEKLDITGFTQELDIRLQDLTGIPCLSIMAEINALMNGSMKSLKHEPDALRIRAAEQENKKSELNQKTEAINNTPESDFSGTVADKSKPKPPSKPVQAPSSAPPNPPAPEPQQPEDLPDQTPALQKLIVGQVRKIAALSTGYIGLMIMDGNNPEQSHYIDNNIFFDVVNFFD
ncbi:MAG: ParB N-terminal domain-containing protein, partial [Gammaproteobacteria bacterium]|nr:ParB N-terminal domain-containing protein [Gammaproteobacteria bacterium]